MSKKTPNRPGISFEEGAKVEAQDYLKKWYPSRIEKLDYEEGKMLVHFERWSHRYDEWISWDSSRVRALERPALRKEGLKDAEELIQESLSEMASSGLGQPGTTDSPAGVQTHRQELRGGEEVLARWTDCRYYPAKIEALNKEGTYRVQFYDGVVRSVKRIHIKSMPEDAKGQDWVALVKAAAASGRSRASSKPRTSANSSRSRDDDAQGGTEDEDTEKDTDEEEHGDRKAPNSNNVSASVSSSSSSSSGGSAGEETPSASDTLPSPGPAAGTHPIDAGGSSAPATYSSPSPSPSRRRRSQRLATTSEPNSDPGNPEPPSPQTGSAPLPDAEAALEREESGHHNYCAGPISAAQPTTGKSHLIDSPTANHTGEKSPPLSTGKEVTASKGTIKSPKSNKHSREPIISTLQRGGEGPCSPSAQEPSQFRCPLAGCGKSFRKAKLLDYHLKYFHSSPVSEVGSPDRVARTRAISTSLSPSSPLELHHSKRRRTVSSSSSLSPQTLLEQVSLRAPGKSSRKKRSSASMSSDSTELSQPSAPMQQPLLPGLEPLHHSLLRKALEPGFTKTDKKIKQEEKHQLLGRKKDRRERRDKDHFKVKLKKKKKKKKKSKQHCYSDYDDLSVAFLERSASPLHHRSGNAFAFLSSSSSSKHQVFPRAILSVDLSGENLSEGEYLEDSTTESLLHSGDDLDLELDGPPEDLSGSSQEIVRCICQMDEENGFMIQCEECMCWQHSVCMGLLEDSIPDQYICYVCRDPPGQRWSEKYRHDREWLLKGHMFGLSSLSENYSEQNSQRIVATHQLLADLYGLKHILHGLLLKMNILQDRHSPSLHLWARSWVNSDEHQPMGGLPDCLHFLDPVNHTIPLKSLQPVTQNSHSSPPPQTSPSSHSEPPTDTYITSEHSYQKPPSPAPGIDPPMVFSREQEDGPYIQSKAGPYSRDPPAMSASGDPARTSEDLFRMSVEHVTAGEPCRTPVEPSRTLEHGRTCVQWQLNLLTHIEDVQEQLANRMDFIEKELDVLESCLDLSGELEPPEPLARLPQLKLSIKQLLADLSKLQRISTLCSV
ncbi:PHD finger protein 20-like protein 1 [Aplochiton taeniatus]